MVNDQKAKEYNIYADIGLPNAEELLQKSKIVFAIDKEMKARRFSVRRAAALLDMEPQELSDILIGRFGDKPLPWFLEKLLKLGLRVELTVIHPERKANRVSEKTVSYDETSD